MLPPQSGQCDPKWVHSWSRASLGVLWTMGPKALSSDKKFIG